MKYYLIVGEASGDLRASHPMAILEEEDPRAEFRLFGGDMMAAVRGAMVKHYKELAYMGFIPVLLHLRTIFTNTKRYKEDIVAWSPGVIVLVDYPGFNLDIARFVHVKTEILVYYYTSPKIWAQKEYRIKNIRRGVDKPFSILPFEAEFLEGHQHPIHYVDNPTVDEATAFRATNPGIFTDFISDSELADKPIAALSARSWKQEIKDNLPDMIRAAPALPDYQLVLAAAPDISPEYCAKFIKGTNLQVIFGRAYHLFQQAGVALVTPGTAILEMALSRVSQVICYHTPIGKSVSFPRKHTLKVKFTSLVNLTAGREVAGELVADMVTVENMRSELKHLLSQEDYQQEILDGYEEMARLFGPAGAPRHATCEMMELLKK